MNPRELRALGFRGLLQRIDALRDLLLGVQDVAQRRKGLGGLEAHLRHLGELELGQAEPARHRIDVAEDHAGLHDVQEAEMRRDDLFEIEERFFVGAELGEGEPDVVVHLGILRILRFQRAQDGQGLVEPVRVVELYALR